MSCANGVLNGSGSGTSADAARGQCAIVTKVLNGRLATVIDDINAQLPAVITAEINDQLPGLVAASLGTALSQKADASALALKADLSAVPAIAVAQIDSSATTAKINALISTAVAALPPGGSGGVTQATLNTALALKADLSAVPAIAVAQIDSSATTAKINALISTAVAAIPSGGSGGVSQATLNTALALKADTSAVPAMVTSALSTTANQDLISSLATAGVMPLLDTKADASALDNYTTTQGLALVYATRDELVNASTGLIPAAIADATAATNLVLADYAKAADMTELYAPIAVATTVQTLAATKADVAVTNAIRARYKNQISAALRYVSPTGTPLLSNAKVQWAEARFDNSAYPSAGFNYVFTAGPASQSLPVSAGYWKVSLNVTAGDGNTNFLRIQGSASGTTIDFPVYPSQIVFTASDDSVSLVNTGVPTVNIISAFITLEKMSDL